MFLFQEILKEFWMPFSKEKYGKRAVLIQDNARPHTAKFTQDALKEMGVTVSEPFSH